MPIRTPAYSIALWAVTAAYLVFGLGAFGVWFATRDDSWVLGFFQGPGALVSCWLSASSLVLAWRATAHFAATEPMHSAWSLFRLSAICDLTGLLASQILASEGPLNPLRGFAFWSEDVATRLRDTGLIVGGTFRYALLAWALWYAIQAYRRSGLLARFRAADHVALWVMGAYVIWETFETITALRVRSTSVFEAASWPVDPLLWFLLAEALLLRRSASEMGGGSVARCWKSLAGGVMLVALGDILLLAWRMGYIPWPYSAVEWYVWLPAGAAFALAPAYQLESIAHATASPAPLE
ncbi:MAG: hypothetical protein KGN36_17065 [Acidobacteriota bacterium]|nr:hypothetical protein [Acidobacteriota bacterium]